MTAVSLVLSILRAIRRAKRLFLALLRAAPKDDILNSTVVFIMCVGLLGPMTLLGWTSNLFKIFSLNSAHILGLIVTQKVKIKERNTSSDLSSIKPMSLVFCVICFPLFDQLEDKILDFVTFRSEVWTDTS